MYVSYVVEMEQVDGTKDLPPSPPTAPFPLPHADNFETYANDSVPRYLSDFEGAFAVVTDDGIDDAEATDSGGSGNKILRQFVRTQPLVRYHCGLSDRRPQPVM